MVVAGRRGGRAPVRKGSTKYALASRHIDMGVQLNEETDVDGMQAGSGPNLGQAGIRVVSRTGAAASQTNGDAVPLLAWPHPAEVPYRVVGVRRGKRQSAQTRLNMWTLHAPAFNR